MILSLLEPVTAPMTPATLTAVLTFVKMTCVLLAALAVTLVMRRAAAGTRHLVWFVALAALLVLPALAVWGPVRVRVLPEAPVTSAEPARPTLATLPATHAPASVEAANGGPAPGVASRPAASASAAPRPIGIGSLLIAIWLLGVVVLLGRLVLGAWYVGRIVHRARVLDDEGWQDPLYEVADRLGLRHAPRLLQSDRVRIPFASGFLKPSIVLPADSEAWSPERRSAVLIHELSHVRRRDFVGHTVGRIACALYWFHPLVWTAARRLRAESERACDDLALVLGARPSEYAEHLLDIVTHVRDHGTPAFAIAMANPHEFEGRILAILDPRVRRASLGRAQTAWLVASVAALALVLGAVSPVPRANAKTPVKTAATPPAPSAPSDLLAENKSAPKKTAGAKPEDARPAVEPAREQGSESRHDDGDEPKNVSDSQRVPILVKTLRTDSSNEVRRIAAWGLAQYAESDVAAEGLAAALTGDTDKDVREMSAWALAESQGHGSAIEAIRTALRRDKSAEVRQTAAWAAGNLADKSLVDGLVAVLSDSDPSMREVAAWSIGSCAPDRAPAALVHLLDDPDRDVRLSAAWALREIGDPSSAAAIEAAFRREKDPEVQHGLIKALGSMGDLAVETLTRLVASPDPEIRAVAVTALAGGHASGPWPWPRPQPRPFP